MHSYDFALLLAFFAIVLLPAPWLGRFYFKVMEGQRTWLSPLLGPVERGCYRLAGVDPGRTGFDRQPPHPQRAHQLQMLRGEHRQGVRAEHLLHHLGMCRQRQKASGQRQDSSGGTEQVHGCDPSGVLVVG